MSEASGPELEFWLGNVPSEAVWLVTQPDTPGAFLPSRGASLEGRPDGLTVACSSGDS